MKITDVTINPDGESVTAIYINGKLYTHGDSYHNSIGDWFNGFLEGLKYAKVKYTVSQKYINDDLWIEECVDCGSPPPKNLKDFDNPPNK